MPQPVLSNHNNEKLDNILKDSGTGRLPVGGYSLVNAISTISSRSSEQEQIHAAILSTIYHLSGPGALRQAKETHLLPKLADSVLRVLTPELRNDPEPSVFLAEAALALILMLCSASQCRLEDSSLLDVAAYTDPRDPWSHTKSAELATDLLAKQITGGEEKRAFITGPVLQGYLKPLFSHSSTRVTASGRPSYYQAAPQPHQPLSEKPYWKKQAPWAIAVTRWVVKESEPQLIQGQWPLFTPVLLALAEDEEPEVKTRGLEILAQFIGSCPSEVLWTTGIGQIFQDVAFPALLYLPGISSEMESNQVLSPTYEVLIKLAERHPDPKHRNKRQLLDRVLRDGVLDGYQHASQHAKVVETLLNYSILIINSLGIYATKHLRSLLSMITSVMTDPFALAHPPTVLAAAKAENALICNCWPRFLQSDHDKQVVLNVGICWLALVENESASTSSCEAAIALDQELRLTSAMLRSLWGRQGMNPPGKLAKAIEQEPRLGILFPPDGAVAFPKSEG